MHLIKLTRINQMDTSKLNIIESKIDLGNITSKHILKKIFEHISIKKTLLLIKYNKRLKERLNLNIDDYKKSYKNSNRNNTIYIE